MNILRLVLATVWIVSLPWFAFAQHDHSKAKESPAKPSSAKTAPAVLKPAEGARINLLSPTNGQVRKRKRYPQRHQTRQTHIGAPRRGRRPSNRIERHRSSRI